MHKPVVHTLKNGARIVVVQDAQAKAVTINAFFRVGSRDEDAEESGVAHFLEHLFFKGGKKYPSASKISQTLDGMGASYNAYTSKEKTSYYIQINKDNAARAADILFDMILSARCASEEVERERKVIFEEIKMYRESPGSHVQDISEQSHFEGDHLGRPILGTEKSLSGLHRSGILRFRATHYTADRCVVVLTGNISTALLRHVKFYASEIPPGSNSEFRGFDKQAPIYQKPRTIVDTRPNDQEHLVLSFFGYPIFDKRGAALGLLQTILGGNMSSRLFTHIREKRGLCYYVRAHNCEYTDIGQFDIRAGVDAGRFEEALEAIIEQVRTLASKGVTEKELASAKEYTRGQIALGYESVHSLDEWYADQLLWHQKKLVAPDADFRMREARVTRQDIVRVAREVFDFKTASLALVGPYDNQKFLEKSLHVKV